VACLVLAADQFPLRDLYPVGARAGGTALQDGPGEGAGQRHDSGAHLPESLFIHAAGPRARIRLVVAQFRTGLTYLVE